MATKVAVVTGSNKGIGYAIVRGLCKQFQGDVYLTARDEGRGQKAVEDLKAEGLNPKFHQLDINNRASIEALRDDMVKQYGGLDILVNNAGIAYGGASTAPFREQTEVTLATNFWATLDCCDVLFPVLKPGARVVHVSSMVSGMAYNKCNDAIKARIRGCSTIAATKQMMTDFTEAVRAGHHEKDGWPNSAYGVSKIGVRAMTPIQQREIAKDTSRPDIVINNCCPGYVNTDLTNNKGHKTIDQGADTPLYLATLPAGIESPRGEFLSERKIEQWP